MPQCLNLELFDIYVKATKLVIRGLDATFVKNASTGSLLLYGVEQPVPNGTISEALGIILPGRYSDKTIDVKVAYRSDGLGGMSTVGGAFE